MYVAKVRVSQHTCSLAVATQDGRMSMDLLEYIILNDEDALFLARITRLDGDPKKYFDIIENHKSTRFLQILEKTPTTLDFLAVIRDVSGIKAFEDAYCFIKPPIKVENGDKIYTVFAPSLAMLKQAYDRLKRIGNWRVEEVKKIMNTKPLLTRSQMRVVKTACEMGYFSPRRKATIKDIADAMGIAKSTAHKHLHEAICRIVEHYMESGKKLEDFESFFE